MTVDFNFVPQFSDGPIREIPRYVFGNCNQATCNEYSPDTLVKLREQAKKITTTTLKILLRVIKKEEEFTKKSEEYDWIYGLDRIEQELLQKEGPIEEYLSVEMVRKINGWLSRMAAETPGKLRGRYINWSKGDITDPLEKMCMVFFQTLVKEQYGDDYFYSITQPGAKLQPHFVKASWLKSKIKLYQRNDLEIEFFVHNEEHKKTNVDVARLDVDKAVDELVKQQGNKNGKIDVIRWLQQKFYFFLPPREIPRELERVVGELKNPELHPIEKAAKIWYEIVRIHISHEANKRTGKAIASAILLSHGYLPPEIGPELTDEYIDALRNSFESEKGPEEFYRFLVREIVQTQEKYAFLVDEAQAASN